MSKKIIGGYEEDAVLLYHFEGDGQKLVKVKHYQINKNELVPVVSVERLEQIAKELEAWGTPDSTMGDGLTYVDGIKDFIKAVRNQVAKK